MSKRAERTFRMSKRTEQTELSIREARRRLRSLARALQRTFVDRHEAINLLILSATAGEPILLLGPPGSAKTTAHQNLRR